MRYRSPTSASDTDASDGIKQFNRFVREILRQHGDIRLVDVFRVFPYIVTIDISIFFINMDSSGLNWYPLWDARNVLHTSDHPFLLLFREFGIYLVFNGLVLAPLFYYILGIGCYMWMRLEHIFPIKNRKRLTMWCWGVVISILLWGLFLAIFLGVSSLILAIGLNAGERVDINIQNPVFPWNSLVMVTYTATALHAARAIAIVLLVISPILTWVLYEPSWSIKMRRNYLPCSWMRF